MARQRSDPPDLAGLASAKFILDVYKQADKELQQFHKSRRPSHLVVSAAILCLGLTRLDADCQEFWDALDDLPKVPAGQRDQVWQGIGNVEQLIGLEYELLGIGKPLRRRDAADTFGDIDALLWDAGRAVVSHKRWPTEDELRKLRRMVGNARQQVCDAAGRPRVPERNLKAKIWSATKVAVGVGVISGNAAAAASGAIPWDLAAKSVLTGVQVVLPRRDDAD